MSRTTLQLASVQTLLITIGFLALGAVMKMRGYPDSRTVHWNPLPVFLREWGILLFILPVLWTIFAGYAERREGGLFSTRVSRVTGISLQIAVLLALFGCSFLRVLTYGSIQGSGGTYTFWGAAGRYFERRHQLLHPAPKTSADWQLSQISLHGEFYPSVALRGAAEVLEDYLNRIDLNAATSRPLTVYLDDVLSEQILPEHRAACSAALDGIFARATRIASARGITLRRGVGRGDVISYGAGERDAFAQRAIAEPKLAVTTHMPDGYGLSITVTNIARTPYTRAHYGKDFRGPATFINEEPIPW